MFVITQGFLGIDVATQGYGVGVIPPVPPQPSTGSGGGGGSLPMKKHHWKDVVPKAKPKYNEREIEPVDRKRKTISLALALLMMED